jgi:hypothetical protein
MNQFNVGDYITAYGGWRGKIRRLKAEMALIEWSYCKDLPTDICTNVCYEDLTLARRANRKSMGVSK